MEAICSRLIECFDIGGTNIRASFVRGGDILHPNVREASSFGSVDLLVRQIFSLSRALRRLHPEIDTGSIDAVSIGVPGPIDNMVMRGSKPLGIEEDVNFKQLLQREFRLPLYVANDMNLAAYGEIFRGEGRGLKNFCLLTLSTGIGVGLVIEGNVYGRNTEIGHDVIEMDPHEANPCLGHEGCWASHASGAGIMYTLARRGDACVDIEDMFADAKNAAFVWEIRTYNAIGIGNLINAYDPEKIILMGSLGINQYRKIIPSINEIGKYTIIRPIPDVVPTILGDDIGLYGAYSSAVRMLG